MIKLLEELKLVIGELFFMRIFYVNKWDFHIGHIIKKNMMYNPRQSLVLILIC